MIILSSQCRLLCCSLYCPSFLLISLPNDQIIKVSFINGKIDDSIAQLKDNYYILHRPQADFSCFVFMQNLKVSSNFLENLSSWLVGTKCMLCSMKLDLYLYYSNNYVWRVFFFLLSNLCLKVLYVPFRCQYSSWCIQPLIEYSYLLAILDFFFSFFFLIE